MPVQADRLEVERISERRSSERSELILERKKAYLWRLWLLLVLVLLRRLSLLMWLSLRLRLLWLLLWRLVSRRWRLLEEERCKVLLASLDLMLLLLRRERRSLGLRGGGGADGEAEGAAEGKSEGEVEEGDGEGDEAEGVGWPAMELWISSARLAYCGTRWRSWFWLPKKASLDSQILYMSGADEERSGWSGAVELSVVAAAEAGAGSKVIKNDSDMYTDGRLGRLVVSLMAGTCS